MATIRSEGHSIILDIIGTGRRTLSSVHMTLDAVNCKVADLHANVTENAEEKRADMLEFSLLNHRTSHMQRMLEAAATLEADPKLAAAYAKRYPEDKPAVAPIAKKAK